MSTRLGGTGVGGLPGGLHHGRPDQQPVPPPRIQSRPFSMAGADLSLNLRATNPFHATSDSQLVRPSSSSGINVVGDKIITPLPMQDASGNRLDLNVAPKLEPPPKFKRRSPHSHAHVTSPEYHSSDSSNSFSSSDTSFSDKRSSRDSAKLPADFNGNDDKAMNAPLNSTALSSAPINTSAPFNSTISTTSHSTTIFNTSTVTQEDRENMNNLNQENKNANTCISPSDSTTKLRLSFSDEENTNSEDSGIPRQSRTLDPFSIDELDTLNT